MSRVLSLTDEQRDQIARESLDHGQMLDSAFAAGVEAATEAANAGAVVAAAWIKRRGHTAPGKG